MNNKFIRGIYKEPGKEPELKQINNTFKDLKNLIKGDFECINYQDFIIIYKKINHNLKPNIWINTGFLKIGTTIRGNIFIINKDEKNNFKSLTNNQILNCKEILIEKSFNYQNLRQKNYDISKYNKNNFQRSLQMERVDSKINSKKFNQEETLKMILSIQAIILKFIKDNS